MNTAGKPTESALSVQGGVVAGRVTEYATELETTCDAVLDAVEDVPLLVDTSENANGYETHERPTDPALRCLAMTRDAFAVVLARVQGRPKPEPSVR
jgi:hypothetical protein